MLHFSSKIEISVDTLENRCTGTSTDGYGPDFLIRLILLIRLCDLD